MVTGNFSLAYDAIKSAKWRSFLTMSGVIIGVMSVVTIVSIGEGVKQQVASQISHLGPDLITIRPGKPVQKDKSGHITGVNFITAFAGNSLTENDLQVTTQTKGVASAIPMSFVTVTPQVDDVQYTAGFVFGTTKGLPEVLNQKVEYGEFFDTKDYDKQIAVIGTRVAEDLFGETVPIGRSMKIRNETFVVRGVFEEFETVSLVSTADYNTAIFIPLGAAKKLNNNQVNIQQILVKPILPQDTAITVQSLQQKLLSVHDGQDDFTILTQEDNLQIASTILDLLTRLISGIAAISLLVGGIGIMNVMLLSVTQRTQEIGLRKAVGATNNQILGQFLTEAVVISFIGGIVGLIGSVFVNFLLRVLTEIEPVITLPIMFISVAVAVVVGIIFGITPALQASRKDPILALRRI